MDTLFKLNHHAYVISGGSLERERLCSILEETHGFALRGNPDVYDRSFNSFSIDHARDLIENHEMKPVTATGKKLFIILANTIGSDAQNALLKLIEEPSSYSHFFFIIPSTHILLPTVKSRVYIIENGSKIEVSSTAKKFLQSDLKERLSIVKSIQDDIAKEKKTKQDAIDFLNNVERAVYEKHGAQKGKEALVLIDECRSFLYDQSPSVKMLLESVALGIPLSKEENSN